MKGKKAKVSGTRNGKTTARTHIRVQSHLKLTNTDTSTHTIENGIWELNSSTNDYANALGTTARPNISDSFTRIRGRTHMDIPSPIHTAPLHKTLNESKIFNVCLYLSWWWAFIRTVPIFRHRFYSERKSRCTVIPTSVCCVRLCLSLRCHGSPTVNFFPFFFFLIKPTVNGGKAVVLQNENEHPAMKQVHEEPLHSCRSVFKSERHT